ncbi:MAG: hypothetical protein AAGA66_05325 [Bacteroidota bacterium]
MKKIATICVLMLSISSSTVLAQSYKVIKVKETVKVNGKTLQANQTIAIRDTDNITFEPSTAKAAIFSSSNGLAILSAPEKSSIQDIIEGQIKDYFKLSKKVTGTRSGNLCAALDFQKQFGPEPYLILNEEARFKVCKSSFPMNASTFFILSYRYENEEEPVYKKLNYDRDELILSKAAIYKVDNQPVDQRQVSNMVLSYYDDEKQVEQVLCKMNLEFAENGELKSEIASLISELKNESISQEELTNNIETYVIENYGSIDRKDLSKWLSSNAPY